MSKTIGRQHDEILALHRFAEALSRARTIEQVFAYGLNALHDIFNPDRAFVAMQEPGTSRSKRSATAKASDSSSLSVPVYAGDQFAGEFILQYGRTPSLSEEEIVLAETIAIQCGTLIASLEKVRSQAELVAMAVHELRSPLTAIAGSTLLIRSGKAVAHSLEVIERNTRLEEALIDDLLSICRIDARKVDTFMTRFDLSALLEELIGDARVSADESGTVIEFEANEPLVVRGNAQRLRQIFSNLLGNSVRCASPKGQIAVRGVVENGFVVVTVRDDGIGIDAGELPHVFDRFRQVRSPGSRPNGGVGLGLAIVKDLVDLHGGSVEADSAGIGKGAMFRVRLAAMQSA
jgi:signal transduction histidine kinase